MGKGDRSQAMQAASRNWKGHGKCHFKDFGKEIRPYQGLEFRGMNEIPIGILTCKLQGKILFNSLSLWYFVPVAIKN